MSANDQPSVLAVCVPATATDAAALDLKQVLAAREQAVARCDNARSNAERPDDCDVQCDAGQQLACNGAGESRCAECDDSACGMNVSRDAAPEPIAESTGASFFHADSGKKALELLRMLRFDLLVTGDRLPDMPVTHLIRRVRIAWPWQKWAMVGAALTTEDEIAARTLGAMAVFDAPPDWDVLSALAATAAASRVAGVKSPHAEARAAGGHERISRADEPRSPGDLVGDRAGSLPETVGPAAGLMTAGKSRGAARAAVLPEEVLKRSVG